MGNVTRGEVYGGGRCVTAVMMTTRGHARHCEWRDRGKLAIGGVAYLWVVIKCLRDCDCWDCAGIGEVSTG